MILVCSTIWYRRARFELTGKQKSDWLANQKIRSMVRFSDMHCIRNDHQSLNDSVAPLVDKTDILDGLLNRNLCLLNFYGFLTWWNWCLMSIARRFWLFWRIGPFIIPKYNLKIDVDPISNTLTCSRAPQTAGRVRKQHMSHKVV